MCFCIGKEMMLVGGRIMDWILFMIFMSLQHNVRNYEILVFRDFSRDFWLLLPSGLLPWKLFNCGLFHTVWLLLRKFLHGSFFRAFIFKFSCFQNGFVGILADSFFVVCLILPHILMQSLIVGLEENYSTKIVYQTIVPLTILIHKS